MLYNNEFYIIVQSFRLMLLSLKMSSRFNAVEFFVEQLRLLCQDRQHFYWCMRGCLRASTSDS